MLSLGLVYAFAQTRIEGAMTTVWLTRALNKWKPAPSPPPAPPPPPPAPVVHILPLSYRSFRPRKPRRDHHRGLRRRRRFALKLLPNALMASIAPSTSPARLIDKPSHPALKNQRHYTSSRPHKSLSPVVKSFMTISNPLPPSTS